MKLTSGDWSGLIGFLIALLFLVILFFFLKDFNFLENLDLDFDNLFFTTLAFLLFNFVFFLFFILIFILFYPIILYQFFEALPNSIDLNFQENYSSFYLFFVNIKAQSLSYCKILLFPSIHLNLKIFQNNTTWENLYLTRVLQKELRILIIKL